MALSQPEVDTVFPSDTALLEQKGYRVLRKLSSAVQGEVFLAESLRSAERFAIKRVNKELCRTKMTFEDEEGLNELIDEDVKKEAAILRHLTLRKGATGDHIAKFIDFFESGTHHFLVTDYVDGVTIAEMADTAHSLIVAGKLSRKQWLKTVKFILWQLTGAVHWLHTVYGCCHLDLCVDNIIIEKGEFEQQRDGSVTAPQQLKVKLVDFGVAELFPFQDSASSSSFACFKDRLSVEHGAYVAPEVMDNAVYDARKADAWSLGIILYRLVTNSVPFVAEDIWQTHNGYAAIKKGCFAQWLREEHLLPLFGKKAAALLESLLHFDEARRPLCGEAMRAKWFTSYWQRYGGHIAVQMARDAARLRGPELSYTQAMPSAKANELLHLDTRSPGLQQHAQYPFESESTKDLMWQHPNHHNFVGNYADGNQIGEEPKGKDSHRDVESEDSHPQKPIGAQQQTRHR